MELLKHDIKYLVRAAEIKGKSGKVEKLRDAIDSTTARRGQRSKINWQFLNRSGEVTHFTFPPDYFCFLMTSSRETKFGAFLRIFLTTGAL